MDLESSLFACSASYTDNIAEADYFLIPLDTFALDQLPRPAQTLPPCTRERTEQARGGTGRCTSTDDSIMITHVHAWARAF